MKALILFVLLFSSFNANAYYSVMDSADLVEEDKYFANVETQFITEGNDGLNLLGRFDQRLTEDSSYRVEVGFGVVDFQLAAFYKWAPIPDIGKQPAFSVAGGVNIARVEIGNETENDVSLRAHPIVSKKFEVAFGNINPYAAVPLGIRTLDGETDLTAQLVLGSFLKTEKFQDLSFAAEIGFDIEEAFTYFSIGVNLNIDPEYGVRFD